MVFLARNPDPPEAPAVLPCRLPPCSRPVPLRSALRRTALPRTPALSRPRSRLSLSLRPAVLPCICYRPRPVSCPLPRLLRPSAPAALPVPLPLPPPPATRLPSRPPRFRSLTPTPTSRPPRSRYPPAPAFRSRPAPSRICRPPPLVPASSPLPRLPCQAFARPHLAVRPAPPIPSHPPSHPAPHRPLSRSPQHSAHF